MKIEHFKDIDSWKEARLLVSKIYLITSKGSFAKDYGLKDQIQRASVSIMSNIAEGFDSGSNKMFINFLNYAFRSASEVESLLYIAIDLKYINSNEFEELNQKIAKIKNLIGGFIQYLKKSNLK
ncbi:four helix bundle protein [Calditrichota bacterium GD2]